MIGVRKQLTLSLPLISAVVRKRNVLRLRLRALLSPRLGDLRQDVDQPLRLSPVFVARNRQGFLEASSRAHLPDVSQCYSDTLQAQKQGTFHVRRFCLCCNQARRMLVDYESCLMDGSGRRAPNWREKLVCSHCGMNNRQRLLAKLVQQSAMRSAHPKIYLMEQVTPIFEWVRNLPAMEVHGSEYLGYEYKGGERVNGVRHEDVMKLSYPDETFDLIVSNDVMEHIPDPERALRECFRVLRPGGAVLATFPFHVKNDTTMVRARLVGNNIEHLLPAQYHGNPVSAEGSLVFSDFGWDFLDVMTAAGFSSAICESYSSDEFGHLGMGLLVFRLSKSESSPAA